MIASLYNGGSQAMIMNLYQRIDRSRVQFDFVVDHPEYDAYRTLVEDLGGKVYTVPVFNGRNFFQVISGWEQLFQAHPEYSILHSHARSYASIYLPVARRNGLKTIVHSHNTSNGKGLSSLAKNILQYPLRYQSDYYFGCSRDAGRWLFGDRIVSSDRFFVLNNAVDAQKFRYDPKAREEYRKQFDIKDENVYLQVGSLSDQKNHLFSLEVFQKLCQDRPDCRLYIAGVGEKEQIIREKIDAYHLNRNVFLLGRRNDVDKLLQMADCYIMPSIYEGLSVAAVEAQASGIPCLLSDVVSREVKITDVCEFLPLDADVWKQRLDDKFVRKDTYDQIKNAGYDISDTSAWLTEFYERIGKDVVR